MNVQTKERIQCRIALPLIIAAALTVAALSTGSSVFLMGALLVWLMMATGFIGVWWAAKTLTITSLLTDTTVQRGEDVALQIGVKYAGCLPIAPLLAEIAAGPDRPAQTLRLNGLPGKEQKLTLNFHAAHVGVTSPGVKKIVISDLLGMFTVEKRPLVQGGELIVLPLPFDVGALTYAAGDSGTESMARASEDVTSPADVRAYQPGDAMKKIHWKLSVRKQELMVRRFEAPVMPDALVLLDCSRPPKTADENAQLDLRDALLETAASVMQQNIQTEHPAKLPIHGDHPIELDKGMGLPVILEALARVDFSAPDKFDRMLMLEMRRMRKVGSTVIISARLNSRMVDVMVAMRRMGPTMRLYLVTFDPDDPTKLPLISKLQSAGIEVCYVTPVQL
ncbi:MAG: DUF58 domain-containing protein [Clostridia bacterium]|nr:DUF58 domain-containing protein [Clostridia bacterium]